MILIPKQHTTQTRVGQTHQNSRYIVWENFCWNCEGGGHGCSEAHSIDRAYDETEHDERCSFGNSVQQPAESKNEESLLREHPEESSVAQLSSFFLLFLVFALNDEVAHS